MKNIYVKQGIILFVMHLVLMLITLLLENTVTEFFYSVPLVFLFFFISTLAVVFLITWVNQNFKDYVGFAFMGLLLVKGLACILFLIPSFLSEPKPNFKDLMLFFIPYFIFLTYEAVFSIRLINRSEN
ncbi:hypothetical protein [Psychroflexus maritimus]|uniref:Uncharacterized protein n=1 Tax=Psychroflexus maritimus TaxID=2714865 RepID=A0A967ABX7_9FLAO|nr:hypothetical protein [Psychroflexus maritimus]NGZ88825.1 hypothetical protein [Psychroflexus maritimus]